MKKITILCLALFAGFAMIAQSSRLDVPKELRDLSIKNVAVSYNDQAGENSDVVPGYKFDFWTETKLGESRYDLQSNYSSQNRIFLFPDGNIGATWTMGFTETAFPDRGTGYNYFDGNSWGPEPTARIETTRTGWPSYGAWGADGEFVMAHDGATGLILNTRPVKGTGVWTESLLEGPAGNEDLLWPRVITNGADNMNIHAWSITTPVGNGGTVYNGMDGALLYNRSLDGGATWDINNVQPDEVTSGEYLAMGGDYYAIADARDDVLAFVVTSKWMDAFLLKSIDNGETWDKTLIWEHPYPMFDWSVTITDTFYCFDGGVSVAIDNNDKCHVAFGISRVGHFDTGDTYTAFPLVDGLGYWNEDMPAFSDDLHALDPYGHPDSELIDDYNLIAWTQDVNGNGTWDVIGTVESVGNYRMGISSMPQLSIDANGVMYLLFSSLTETFQTADQNYRHLWTRVSFDNGVTWEPEFVDLNSGVVHIFSECVFPSMSQNVDDALHIVYQMDNEPGGAVQGDEDPYSDNHFPYINIPIAGLGVSVDENNSNFVDFATQNAPNPASTFTDISFHLLNPTSVSIEVFNITGQMVKNIKIGEMPVGVHTYTMNVNDLTSGTYFYKVIAGSESVTHKMLIN